jgi:tellurite resistance protein TerC
MPLIEMTQWHWWFLFFAIVVGLVALDLGLLRIRKQELRLHEAALGMVLRVALAMLFCLGIYHGWIGGYPSLATRHEAGAQFLTAYLVEISLSVDNVFVFALLFRSFHVNHAQQQRVLHWGIAGAVVMRAVFIFAGVTLVAIFHWFIYLLALIVFYGGIRMMWQSKIEIDPTRNPALRLARKLLPVSESFHGTQFFTKRHERYLATPLLLVLIAVETTDLVFAADSIPAVLAVSTDPFIVFTSNIFAILGLRALYFTLAGGLRLLRFLHYGLSAILVFVGVKMLLENTPLAISTAQSLVVIGALLGATIIASLLFPDRNSENFDT